MTSRGLAAALLGIVGAYTFAVRPRLLRWGASDEELQRGFPGSDLIPDGQRSSTTCTTIEAPPSAVWPRLAQMGVDRAGWYSWDRLDNLGRHSAQEIHPEWQEIAIGDRFVATPNGSMWWEVAACEPERLLVLRMSIDLRGMRFDPNGERPRFYTDSTWGWLLEEAPAAGPGSSRAVIGV
jgi:proline iminopeptidase